MKVSKGLGPGIRGPRPRAAHLGVVSAEQAVVSGPYACALTMTIAATLCGAVAAHKAEVAAAVVGFHTGAIHTALSTHRAAYACHAVGQSGVRGDGQGRRLPAPSDRSHHLQATDPCRFYSDLTASQVPPTRLACSFPPTHTAAAASLVHGVACLAAALVAMGLVVAVLGLIAVMVPICTLVLRGAGQEGPGCPRTPTCQPWPEIQGFTWVLLYHQPSATQALAPAL